MREYLQKDIHYLKDITLETLRKQMTQTIEVLDEEVEDEMPSECVGICDTKN
jgi:hypothetical protein